MNQNLPNGLVFQINETHIGVTVDAKGESFCTTFFPNNLYSRCLQYSVPFGPPMRGSKVEGEMLPSGPWVVVDKADQLTEELASEIGGQEFKDSPALSRDPIASIGNLLKGISPERILIMRLEQPKPLTTFHYESLLAMATDKFPELAPLDAINKLVMEFLEEPNILMVPAEDEDISAAKKEIARLKKELADVELIMKAQMAELLRGNETGD